jgi:hypothetical protein
MRSHRRAGGPRFERSLFICRRQSSGLKGRAVEAQGAALGENLGSIPSPVRARLAWRALSGANLLLSPLDSLLPPLLLSLLIVREVCPVLPHHEPTEHADEQQRNQD